MNDPQRKDDIRDYPTVEPQKFVVIIMGRTTHGEIDDKQIIGGAVVGPFSTREETMELIRWMEEKTPIAAKGGILGSAQMMSEAEFKQAVTDAIEKTDLLKGGHLHS